VHQRTQTGPLRLALLTLVTAVATQVHAADAPTTPSPAGTTGYWQEMHRPVVPWDGPPRNGEQVYENHCKTCHGRSTQGAPMPGERSRWAIRTQQGMDTLLQHAIDGYNQQLMPPRGACHNCSDAEVRAGILYMLNQSGIILQADGSFAFAPQP